MTGSVEGAAEVESFTLKDVGGAWRERGGCSKQAEDGECPVQVFSEAEAKCGVSNWQCLFPRQFTGPQGSFLAHLWVCCRPSAALSRLLGPQDTERQI